MNAHVFVEALSSMNQSQGVKQPQEGEESHGVRIECGDTLAL